MKPNEAVPFEIRWESDELLVVEKPAGVVTQPGKKHEDDSLLNGLFVRYGKELRNLGEARSWGLLHRLDKGTSGLVLVALRNRAYDHLRAQFEQRQVRKVYWALVVGRPRPVQGVIQKPITEVVSSRKKAVIKRGGKQAITAYRVLESAEDVSLVEARPKTGRLHQVRIHLASLGHPLLGETLYAGKIELPAAPRLCLHAAGLSFIEPATGRRLTMDSPLPKDLRKTLKRFGLEIPPVAGR